MQVCIGLPYERDKAEKVLITNEGCHNPLTVVLTLGSKGLYLKLQYYFTKHKHKDGAQKYMTTKKEGLIPR